MEDGDAGRMEDALSTTVFLSSRSCSLTLWKIG